MRSQPKYVWRQLPPSIDPKQSRLVQPCEIGENDDPRSYPDLWCDRVVCREFFDIDLCRSTVVAMNRMHREQASFDSITWPSRFIQIEEGVWLRTRGHENPA